MNTAPHREALEIHGLADRLCDTADLCREMLADEPNRDFAVYPKEGALVIVGRGGEEKSVSLGETSVLTLRKAMEEARHPLFEGSRQDAELLLGPDTYCICNSSQEGYYGLSYKAEDGQAMHTVIAYDPKNKEYQVIDFPKVLARGNTLQELLKAHGKKPTKIHSAETIGKLRAAHQKLVDRRNRGMARDEYKYMKMRLWEAEETNVVETVSLVNFLLKDRRQLIPDELKTLLAEVSRAELHGKLATVRTVLKREYGNHALYPVMDAYLRELQSECGTAGDIPSDKNVRSDLEKLKIVVDELSSNPEDSLLERMTLYDVNRTLLDLEGFHGSYGMQYIPSIQKLVSGFLVRQREEYKKLLQEKPYGEHTLNELRKLNEELAPYLNNTHYLYQNIRTYSSILVPDLPSGEIADKTSIKKAYRELSIKHHPDKSSTEESKKEWQKIDEAYQFLKPLYGL